MISAGARAARVARGDQHGVGAGERSRVYIDVRCEVTESLDYLCFVWPAQAYPGREIVIVGQFADRNRDGISGICLEAPLIQVTQMDRALIIGAVEIGRASCREREYICSG